MGKTGDDIRRGQQVKEDIEGAAVIGAFAMGALVDYCIDLVLAKKNAKEGESERWSSWYIRVAAGISAAFLTALTVGIGVAAYSSDSRGSEGFSNGFSTGFWVGGVGAVVREGVDAVAEQAGITTKIH